MANHNIACFELEALLLIIELRLMIGVAESLIINHVGTISKLGPPGIRLAGCYVSVANS